MPYHAITCLVDCEGWPCTCPCHDTEQEGT